MALPCAAARLSPRHLPTRTGLSHAVPVCGQQNATALSTTVASYVWTTAQPRYPSLGRRIAGYRCYLAARWCLLDWQSTAPICLSSLRGVIDKCHAQFRRLLHIVSIICHLPYRHIMSCCALWHPSCHHVDRVCFGIPPPHPRGRHYYYSRGIYCPI